MKPKSGARTTLSESIYNLILSDIKSGALKPSDPIRELTVARTHGVSRTPVRKALDRLVRKGFACRTPNQGVRVTRLSPARIEKIHVTPLGAIYLTTVRERVYDKLLEWITSGRIKPGERLVAGRLAGELGVGETPIIFALQMLDHGGLVRKAPRKGYFVQAVDSKQIENIYDLREYFAGAAAALAARTMGEAGREALKGLYRKKMDRRTLIGADIAFHRIVMENCGNDLLQKQLGELLLTIRLFHIGGLQVTRGRLLEVVSEHKAIIRALLEGDPELSESLMRLHIRRSKAHALREMVAFGLAVEK